MDPGRRQKIMPLLQSGGGKGCLCVNTTSEGVCDKTWQDIIDAVNSDTFAYIQEKIQTKGSPLSCDYHLINKVFFDEFEDEYAVLCDDGQYYTAETADGTLTRQRPKPVGGSLSIICDPTTYQLDKTWQQICDAMNKGIPCVISIDLSGGYEGYVETLHEPVSHIYTSWPVGEYYEVESMNFNGTPSVDHWVAESADDYPVFVNQ